jgi:hypothetical protein
LDIVRSNEKPDDDEEEEEEEQMDDRMQKFSDQKIELKPMSEL